MSYQVTNYDLAEETAAQLQDLRQDVKHLSQAIDGLIKKVQYLEKIKEQQEEMNQAISEAIGEIADELEMLSAEEEAES